MLGFEWLQSSIQLFCMEGLFYAAKELLKAFSRQMAICAGMPGDITGVWSIVEQISLVSGVRGRFRVYVVTRGA